MATSVKVDSSGTKWLVRNGKKIQNLGSAFPSGALIKNLTVKKNEYGGKNILNTVNYQHFQGTSKNDLLYNKGINAFVKGNNGNDIILNYADKASLNGGSGKDYIYTGANTKGVTLYGGMSNDTLVGSDKYGDVYQFGNYDGNDVILNYGTKDTIRFTNIWSKSDIKCYISGSNKIIYNNKYGGTRITLKGAANKKVTVKYGYSGKLIIGGTTYTSTKRKTDESQQQQKESSTSTCNPSTSIYTEPVTIPGTTMTVSGKPTADIEKIKIQNSTDTKSNNLLTYEDDVSLYYSKSSCTTLIGSSRSDTITAGTGTNKLWGNSGYNNDTLIGNSGTDHFYYGKNQGNDVIQNAGSGDYVRLYNIRQSDVSSYSNTDSGFKLNVGSGSLTIDKTDGVTFVFKGGARYAYNADTNKFRRE